MLWLKGKHNLKVRKEIGDGWISAGTKQAPRFIRKSEIPQFVDDEFWAWFAVWHKFHAGLGLPFAGGWANQGQPVVEVLELMQAIYRNRSVDRAE